ncbi:hypothetical protein SAMN05444285_12113 [Draconibacterium orientale]|uniref:BioF2-like acetyltransferase domain-containing protein n=1 Tax=Draconibacterium orientale TaxID=1168034 RepID=X5DFB9_9BACT|nr:hypothetical protein [Draconibacterium orientale]AHW61613.1 hypothetical protein FH5T_04905 [Draconibacterium orientale]SET71975.1 hypothetical protein SAMN05444285_12113 [Draconibacterium orientale]
MRSENKIHYIKHALIDSEKWNQCIDGALNCRIYAYDWHLDRTAIEWDALVYGNYEYVMPLPFRKKLGIKYLYQPLFSQQLGIFPTPSKAIFDAFIDAIKDRFKYADVQLNALNVPGENSGDIFFERKNYLLSLTKDFKSIISGYSKNTKRNIAKAQNQDLTIIEGIRHEDYLAFKAKNLPAGVEQSAIAKLKSLIAFGEYKGFGKIYGVYTPENNLCAAVYFCRWKDRVIYFNAASNEEGKNTGAMYYLVNRFIEDNAGKNLLLDFEGSMIPGVERFYSGFGAKPETYFHLKYNRLPLLLRWLKR